MAITYTVSKAFVLLTLDFGSQDATKGDLLTINGIAAIYKVEGAYDFCLVLERDSLDELRTTISKIRKIESIRSSLTLIVR